MDVEMTLSIDDLFRYLEHVTEMKELRRELTSEEFIKECEAEPELFTDDEDFDELADLMFKQIMIVVKGTNAVSARIADIVNDYKQRYNVPPDYLPVVSVFANAIERRESNQLLQKAFADRRQEEAKLKEQNKKETH